MSFWYSNQSVSIRWQNTQSESFGIQNGTRQGSVLSPFLFRRYIRQVLSGIVDSNIGCNIGGYMVSILAYANDLVAYCWLHPGEHCSNCLINCKLQLVILICVATARKLCMIFRPKCRSKAVAYQFPNFTINNEQLSLVNEFKYLGHIINNSQLDDGDIYRERRNLFYRCNMLARRFYSCSVAVKLWLFKKVFACVFMMQHCGTILLQALLINLGQRMWNALRFFGYTKFYSVTAMLNYVKLFYRIV